MDNNNNNNGKQQCYGLFYFFFNNLPQNKTDLQDGKNLGDWWGE